MQVYWQRFGTDETDKFVSLKIFTIPIGFVSRLMHQAAVIIVINQMKFRSGCTVAWAQRGLIGCDCTNFSIN